MQYVVYGHTAILVSNAAATAVLAYATALSNRSLSAVVTVPAVDLAGFPTSMRLLLGPGIPVLTQDAGDDVLESEDRPFVSELAQLVVDLEMEHRPW